MNNPNCDGSHCQAPNGEVRRLPYGGGGNLILCRACYDHEIQWRKQCRANGREFEVPRWENLTVYAKGGV